MCPGNALEFAILHEDIAEIDADVVVLKYAQSFHGADHQISAILAAHGLLDRSAMKVEMDEEFIVATNGTIAASHVLFFGLPALWQLRYHHVFEFGQRLVTSKKIQELQLNRLATTIHGPGVGLDEAAAFLAQLAGIVQALVRAPSWTIESIAFVERDAERARRLKLLFEQRFHGDDRMQRSRTGSSFSFLPQGLMHPGARLA